MFQRRDELFFFMCSFHFSINMSLTLPEKFKTKQYFTLGWRYAFCLQGVLNFANSLIEMFTR